MSNKEVFRPVFQGEGIAAGRFCMFVRFAECNQHCTWCDTPQTWSYTRSKAAQHNQGRVYDKRLEVNEMSVDEILADLRAMREDPCIVVISGGEPLLQSAGLEELVAALWSAGYVVHIETAGTIMPTDWQRKYVDVWNV